MCVCELKAYYTYLKFIRRIFHILKLLSKLELMLIIYSFMICTLAFCYMTRGENGSCNAKEGNPFGPFWDTFDIDFVSSEFYEPLHYDVYHSKIAEEWKEKYPPSKWPG